MRFSPLGWTGVVVLLASAAGTGAATAGNLSSPLLGLDLGRCPAVAPVEVENMVGVELHRPVLRVDDVATGDIPRPAITTVRVTCEELRATIVIRDPLTGKTVERVVDLQAAAPVARPHLLALSIVELLAASWMELQTNPNPPSPTPAGAAATPEAREAALEVVGRRPGAPRSARISAAGSAQTSTTGLTSWGGGVIVAGDPIPHLAWLVDLAFQHGERAFTLGRVTADTASALGAVLARAARNGFALRAGLGIRGGGAWLSGAPHRPPTVGGTVRGGWWGPVALLDGSWVVTGRVVVGITVEAGRVLLPVIATVEGGDPVAIDGNWIKGTLGVGFTL